MAARLAILKSVKWSLAFALGLQVLIALLLFGKYPFLFRGGIYSQARADREGMRLAVYDNLNRSGPAEARLTPDASARLAIPHTSLEGYGIWQVKKAGTYTLVLHCDDYGSLFLDGHPLISLKGISADNMGQAVVPLQAGPHLLVVYLFNDPQKGFFRLEVQGPGDENPVPLLPLRPAALESGKGKFLLVGGSGDVNLDQGRTFLDNVMRAAPRDPGFHRGQNLKTGGDERLAHPRKLFDGRRSWGRSPPGFLWPRPKRFPSEKKPRRDNERTGGKRPLPSPRNGVTGMPPSANW